MITELDKKTANEFCIKMSNGGVLNQKYFYYTGYLAACKEKNIQMIEFTEWVIMNATQHLCNGEIKWNTRKNQNLTTNEMLVEFLKQCEKELNLLAGRV